jgi:hypothetical protein
VKERKPANVTLRIVGHRSRLNRQWRLSPRQWQIAIGVGVGVIPLLLAFGVYGLLRTVAPDSFGGGTGVAPVAAAHAEVASLARDTTAGLDVIAIELGALNANAVQLARLERQLVHSTGISLARAHTGALAMRALPVSSPDSSRLITKLHALAQRLAPAAHRRRAL